MNLSEMWIIGEDEILRGSKSKYLLTIAGIFIFLCLLVLHYSTSILSLFPLKNNGNIPYYLISYLAVLVLGPFLIMIASFDFISNEVETGSIRYIISKVDRTLFISGKFLALFIIFTFTVFIIAVISLIYGYISNNAFQFENTILFLVFSSLYLGCFISIFLFISTLSENNKTSFIMSIVFSGILFFFLVQGNDNYLKYLTPYYYGIKNIGLFVVSQHEIEFISIFKNIFAMVIYITIFLSMSLFAIKRKDL